MNGTNENFEQIVIINDLDVVAAIEQKYGLDANGIFRERSGALSVGFARSALLFKAIKEYEDDSLCLPIRAYVEYNNGLRTELEEIANDVHE